MQRSRIQEADSGEPKYQNADREKLQTATRALQFHKLVIGIRILVNESDTLWGVKIIRFPASLGEFVDRADGWNVSMFHEGEVMKRNEKRGGC